MAVTVNLYGKTKDELNKFLSHFYNTNFDLENLSWQKNTPILSNWLK